MTVPVTGEWALWGKGPRDRDYHVLECSDGPVSREDFDQVLTMYSPGTLEAWPQVTIGWLREWAYYRPHLGYLGYLGIAIHDRPEPGRRDATGRQIALTRYFCVPFRELAIGAVSYQAMFEGFEEVELRPGDRSPIPTELAAWRPGAPPGRLAARVAALLLTDRPVRIVGAEKTTELGERLRFLDDVASLLPYGMRSQLSCSTWVSSTMRGHARLFFSSHRVDGEGDHEVIWGRDDAAPTGNPFADQYLRWLLADVPRRVAQLAERTEPMDIDDRGAIQQVLAELDEVAGYAAHLRARYDREQRSLAEIARRLIALAALLRRQNTDAELKRNVRQAIAAVDKAAQQAAPRLSAPWDIPAQQAAIDQLTDLASRSSRLAEEVTAAVLARYDASLRDLREAREKLAALKALAAVEGFGGRLERAAERLGAEMDEAISASDALRELMAQRAPDVAALQAEIARPLTLTSSAQKMLDSISSELSRFSVSLSYPKLICAGFSSTFLVQVFLPRRQRAAAARVKNVFAEIATTQVAREARFQLGMKIRISLSSPAMEFSASVQKVIFLEGADTTFTGRPRPFALPGAHAAVLTVSNEHGDQELLSIPFQVNIVNYAFDHISRPVAGRVVGGVVGVVSACVLALAIITRTAQVLDAASGAVGLALSAFVFTRINSLYSRHTISEQGVAQNPPAQQPSADC